LYRSGSPACTGTASFWSSTRPICSGFTAIVLMKESGTERTAMFSVLMAAPSFRSSEATSTGTRFQLRLALRSDANNPSQPPKSAAKTSAPPTMKGALPRNTDGWGTAVMSIKPIISLTFKISRP
jgi:hypothetical protein